MKRRSVNDGWKSAGERLAWSMACNEVAREALDSGDAGLFDFARDLQLGCWLINISGVRK